MVYYFLLGVSVLLSVCKSMVYNRFAKTQQPNLTQIFRFNMLCYGVAALVTLCCGVGKTFSPYTVLVAAGYAVSVFLLQALSIFAMRTGPMSLTSLFVLYGMIIPSVAGPLFWKEPFGGLQIAGMVIMLLSLGLLTEKDTSGRNATAKWGLLVFVCFWLSGMAGLFEKIHQTSPAKEERLQFLLIAFCFMVLFSGAGALFCHKKNLPAVQPMQVKTLLLWGALTGCIAGLYCQVNLTLSGKLDSLLYYPVANGGSLLLTVLVSIVIFREKPTKKRLVGFILGLISILLLSFPAV